MAAQTAPLAALVTKVVGRLSAGMLQADGGATTIKFDGGLPAGMLMANSGADDAFSCPGHKV